MNSENKLIGAGLLTAITLIMLHYTSFGSNLEQAEFQLKIFLDRTFLTLPDCNDNFNSWFCGIKTQTSKKLTAR
jgi:hypothetical protein